MGNAAFGRSTLCKCTTAVRTATGTRLRTTPSSRGPASSSREACRNKSRDITGENLALVARGLGDALLADCNIRPGHPSPSPGRDANTHVARSRLCGVRHPEPYAWAAAGVRVVHPARTDLRAGHGGHSRRLRRRCELDRPPPPRV